MFNIFLHFCFNSESVLSFSGANSVGPGHQVQYFIPNLQYMRLPSPDAQQQQIQLPGSSSPSVIRSLADTYPNMQQPPQGSMIFGQAGGGHQSPPRFFLPATGSQQQQQRPMMFGALPPGITFMPMQAPRGAPWAPQ